MNEPLARFLSAVPPFDILPEDQVRDTARLLFKVHYFRDMVLFVQDKTIVNHVYILMEGRLERYILEGGKKIVQGELGEKDIYGALSILFNKGIAISTVCSREDVTFYCLPQEKFLELCYQNEDFIQAFTAEFTARMKEKPYIEHIARAPRASEENEPGGFLHQPLKDVFAREVVSCPRSFTIQKAAQAMTQRRKDAIVVIDSRGTPYGLLTDHDLREKVVARGLDYELPVEEVASSPLQSTSLDAQVFEALFMMMQHNVRHLVVFDEHQDLCGVITDQDLLLSQGHSPVFLMHEIQVAASVEEIGILLKKLPDVVNSLLSSGARAGHLNNMITAISDAALQRVVDFALQEAGPPPVDFAFLIMGSEGRKEQTLKTDQDNAIVYEDPDPSRETEIKDYFLKLGDRICNWLDQAGFSFCEYEIMAKNPKWCQPISAWKNYFRDWIYRAEPESLLFASIFFDFRLGAGSRALVEDLQDYLYQSLSGWAGLFRHLAENSLHFKPPLDFFGNMILETKGTFKDRLDIKSPMRLIVDFARLHALKNNVRQTNTIERLNALYLATVLDKNDYEDLRHAYNFLMRIRLAHQAKNMVEDLVPPDNYIDPRQLSHIDQQSLKQTFKCIREAQAKLRMEFVQYTGIT